MQKRKATLKPIRYRPLFTDDEYARLLFMRFLVRRGIVNEGARR